MCLLFYQTVNVFPFPPGVRTHINSFHIFTIQKSADDAELFLYVFNDFILKFGRYKRNSLKRPSFIFFIISFRIAHGYQMPHTPRDDRFRRLHVSVPVARVNLQCLGKFSGNAWLFGYINTFSHYISSILINLRLCFSLASRFSCSSKLPAENK